MHDYGQGGLGILVDCDEPEELSKALGDTWEVVTENIESHPFYKRAMEREEQVYDFHNPSGLLKTYLYISARQSEGKTAFPIQVRKWWSKENRDVWAKSKEEVEKRFPHCQFLYGQVIEGRLEYSDIDSEDDFIKKFGSNNT